MSTGENTHDVSQQNLSNLYELVIIVSSAGSAELFMDLVSALPADFPTPVILAIPHDLNPLDNLGALLQKRSALPVHILRELGDLQPGQLYLASAGHRMTVGDRRMANTPHGSLHSALDALLRSASEIYNDRLIVVLLDGSQSESVTGSVDVKNAGGLIIAVNNEGDSDLKIPLTLPPNTIDFQLQHEQIIPFLNRLLSEDTPSQSEHRPEAMLPRILELAGQQANIDFRHYKTPSILRRITRRMVTTRSATMNDYAQYLETHPEEIGELINAFFINVTQFFRDEEAFEYLRTDLLPALISKGRQRDQVLRFWSAGCASGEEAYSLAMLLADLLTDELPQWSIKIFATDIDEAAITFARRGLYSESELKSVPEHYRQKFFEHIDQGYRVSKTLRQMVIFGHQDLARSSPFPRIDLTICRNVLIYFTTELQDYVLAQFAFSLCPDGYLFLGKAETVRSSQTTYHLINKTWKVYRCGVSAVPIARRFSSLQINRISSPNSNPLPNTPAPLARLPLEPAQDTSLFEIAQFRRFNELMLRFLAVGLVVIDRSYRLISANGTARRLLGLRDSGHDQDFLHAVRGIPYREVRQAIDRVFREHVSVTLNELELVSTEGGNGHFISLSIGMMPMEGELPDLAVLSINDVTETVQTRRQLEATQIEQKRLMDEISQTNQRLNDLNKELMDANEELHITNEELILTHEELQSTIEEFETTNEELQATNEELETNNEEFQATNEELQTTNEELRARTNDLIAIAAIVEDERTHLNEMVECAPFGIMVLRGKNLVIKMLSPGFARLLDESSANTRGCALKEFAEIYWQDGLPLVDLATHTFMNNEAQTSAPMRIRLKNEPAEIVARSYIFTCVPTHTNDGAVDGAVIYANDMT